MVTNVLLAGVGGQGTVTASSVLGQACRLAGWQVKKSEVHGMSQRGGSVDSFVRFSPESPVFSPLIPVGEVDYLVAFEPLEGLRQIRQTRPQAVVVVEQRPLVPVTVSTGSWKYPADVLQRLRAFGREVIEVAAFARAQELGEPRAANMVLIGVLSARLDLPLTAWEQALQATVKPQAMEVNLQAFREGRKLGGSAGA